MLLLRPTKGDDLTGRWLPGSNADLARLMGAGFCIGGGLMTGGVTTVVNFSTSATTAGRKSDFRLDTGGDAGV